MVKVYQIFLDGAAGWITCKPSDFEDEIVCHYCCEHDHEIPQGRLIKIMNKLNNMQIGDHVYFDNDMDFICFEMGEEEFNNMGEFVGW